MTVRDALPCIMKYVRTVLFLRMIAHGYAHPVVDFNFVQNTYFYFTF